MVRRKRTRKYERVRFRIVSSACLLQAEYEEKLFRRSITRETERMKEIKSKLD
jgi:hypothetical protein